MPQGYCSTRCQGPLQQTPIPSLPQGTSSVGGPRAEQHRAIEPPWHDCKDQLENPCREVMANPKVPPASPIPAVGVPPPPQICSILCQKQPLPFILTHAVNLPPFPRPSGWTGPGGFPLILVHLLAMGSASLNTQKTPPLLYFTPFNPLPQC